MRLRRYVPRAVFLALAIAPSACGGGATIGAGSPERGGSPTPVASSSPSASGATPTATPAASSTPTPTPTLTPNATALPSATASATAAPPPAGGASSASIYLGDIAQGAVLIYSSNANGNVSPSAIVAGSNTGFTSSSGDSGIYGIAVDGSGAVYVLTQTEDSTGTTIVSESILVFAAGSSGNVAPSRVISLPTSIDAESLAYANGNLYVTDDAGSGAIDVYASNATGEANPARTFTDATAFPNPPLKVSVDGSGDAYVSTYDITATAATEATQGVYEFGPAASGSATTTNAVSGSNTGFGNGVLEAAVIDSAGTLDAVLQDSANDIVADIDEFTSGATGNAAPTTSFQDAASQGPIDAAIDASRDLYVSEVANSTSYAQVDVFAPGATAPQQTVLAYEAELPLIAIGPYVSVSPSATMPLTSRRLGKAALARLRSARAHRRLFGRLSDDARTRKP